MKELLEEKIAELVARRAQLEAQKVGAPEFNRPEQDSQAAEYRRGWRQSFDGIDRQLAYYRRRLNEV